MITEHIETTETDRAEAVDFIRFHGLKMMVVAHEGKDYVPVRPICELIGVDWRGQKRVLEDPYKTQLYGICWLFPPEIDGFSELKFAPNCYIRVNRVEAFLFGINPKRVEANGNVDAAKWLMALQHEWADALHAYETHGIAVKPGRAQALRELHQMIRSRERLRDPGERAALTALIREELAAMGLPADTLDNDQQQSDLPLPISLV